MILCVGNISDRDGFLSRIRDSPAPQVLLGQPNQLPYRQPIDPETYDGKTSVEEYLKRFEQITDWNRWDDKEAAIQLSLHLKGSAKRIVKTLPENQRRSYNHMWSILNSTFGEKVNVMALHEEFWRRTKQPEEHIPEFAIQLESIAKKAFSEFLLNRNGEKALEQLIIKCFIAGVAVGNDPMGRYIHLQHPSSLQQAVSLAQHYHAYDEMNPHMQRQSKDQVYNIQEDGPNVDDIMKEVKSLAQEVWSMMSGPAEAETDKKIIQRTEAEVKSTRQELTELKLMVAIQKQEISQQCSLISANANAIDELKQMWSQQQSHYVQPDTNKPWVHKKRRRRKRKPTSNTLDHRGSDGVPDNDVTTHTNNEAHKDSFKFKTHDNSPCYDVYNNNPGHDLYDNSPGYDILESSPDHYVHDSNPGYDDHDNQDYGDTYDDQDGSVIFDIQDDSVVHARNDGVIGDAQDEPIIYDAQNDGTFHDAQDDGTVHDAQDDCILHSDQDYGNIYSTQNDDFLYDAQNDGATSAQDDYTFYDAQEYGSFYNAHDDGTLEDANATVDYYVHDNETKYEVYDDSNVHNIHEEYANLVMNVSTVENPLNFQVQAVTRPNNLHFTNLGLQMIPAT